MIVSFDKFLFKKIRNKNKLKGFTEDNEGEKDYDKENDDVKPDGIGV